jgi:hypothetical protein
MPSDPPWSELQRAIIRENGNLCRLVMDLTDRAFQAVTDTWPPGMKLTWPTPPQPPAPPAVKDPITHIREHGRWTHRNAMANEN